MRLKLASLALVSCFGGCVCEPDGISAYQEADGVLTEQEKQAYQDFRGNVMQFEGMPQQFTNDLDELISQEFERKGLPSHRIGSSLYIYLGSEEEVKDEYGGDSVSFYRFINNTIYMANDWFDKKAFINTFFHEVGHHLREEDNEYYSMANQIYASFKVYCLDNEIGFDFADNTLSFDFRPDNIRDYCPNGTSRKYAYGGLAFLVEANKQNGDLEKTLQKILASSSDYLHSNVVNKGREYDNVCNMIFNEYENLLEQPQFVEDFMACSEEPNNFTEYINYLSNRLVFYYEWLCREDE